MAMQEITRRSFVKATTALISTAAAGLASVSLWGCADNGGGATADGTSVGDEALPEGDVSLTIEEDGFSVNGAAAVPFTAEKLHIMPYVSQDSVVLYYTDENGEDASVTLGKLGDSVSVHGKIGMLTADGSLDSGDLIVGEDADINVLTLGSLEKADVEGEVDCLIVVGNTNVKAHSGSTIEHLLTNPSVGKVEKEDGATIQSAWSTDNVAGNDIADIVEDTESVVHERHAAETNRLCLSIFGDEDPANNEDWREKLEEGVTGDSAQPSVNAASSLVNLFLPTTAYADESKDDSDDVLDAGGSSADDSSDDDPSIDDSSNGDADGGDGSDPDDVAAETAAIADAQFLKEDEFLAQEVEPGDDDPTVDLIIPDDPSECPDDVSTIAVPLADDEDGGIGLVEEVLAVIFEKLADAAAEAIMDKLTEEGWNAVFGDETAQSLKRIEAQLDQLQKEVSEILELIEQLPLKIQVDNYISGYTVPLDTWLGTHNARMANYDAEADKTKAAGFKKEEAVNLLKDNPADADKLFGLPVQEACKLLGKMLLSVGTSSCNVLEAFDELMLKTYKWEHQAYSPREQFQTYVLGQFLSLASWAEFALRVNIDLAQKGSKRYKDLVADRKGLFRTTTDESPDLADDPSYLDRLSEYLDDTSQDLGIVVQVKNMYMGTESNPGPRVVRRDESQRYYQVAGHEMLFAAQLLSVATKKNRGDNQRHLLTDKAGHKVPTMDQWEAILNDYQGSGKTIDDILYGTDEGNFGKPDNWQHWRYLIYSNLDKKYAGMGNWYVYAPYYTYKGKQTGVEVYSYIDGKASVLDTNFNCLYVLDTGVQPKPWKDE